MKQNAKQEVRVNPVSHTVMIGASKLAKYQLETLHQTENDVCPRCGYYQVDMHTTSNHAKVHICPNCLMEENQESALGMPQLMLEDWAYMAQNRC